jgi:hypothetical protein
MNDTLLAQQWQDYPRVHRTRANLVLHALTVPLFWAGLVAFVAGWHAWPWSAAGLALMVTATAIQGRGHRQELARPRPFRGPLNMVGRLVSEQCVTFPRFVLTGGFARAWRQERCAHG